MPFVSPENRSFVIVVSFFARERAPPFTAACVDSSPKRNQRRCSEKRRHSTSPVSGSCTGNSVKSKVCVCVFYAPEHVYRRLGGQWLAGGPSALVTVRVKGLRQLRTVLRWDGGECSSSLAFFGVASIRSRCESNHVGQASGSNVAGMAG